MDRSTRDVSYPEPAAGVGTPPDDGGHMGSYTVPSDMMDQTVGSHAVLGTQREHARIEPRSGFPVVGLIVVVLVLAGMTVLTLSVGL